MGNASHGLPAGMATLLLPLALVAAASTYLAAVARQRGGRRRWSGWRTASWLAGLALLAFALAPPLASLAHHDLRAHMAQHLLVGMFAPLGMVLAAPATLALRALPAPAARRAVALLHSRPLRLFSHPLSALLLNVGGMYLLYLTPLYALSRHNPLIHQAVHLHILAAGCLFSWAIVAPDPGPRRAYWPTRLAVLFAAMAAHGALAKLMYAHGWPRGAPHGQAQLEAAAQLMYYGGDAAALMLAIALFAQWYQARGRQLRRAGPASRGEMLEHRS